MNKTALIKAISSESLPYIKNQTLAGVTLDRISKGLIGTATQVRNHIEAFNAIEPKLDVNLKSDITYVEEAELDKVVGREEELLEFLMDRYKDSLSITTENADGIMRMASLAEMENTKALIMRLQKIQESGTIEVEKSNERTFSKERAYFTVARKRENNYARFLREYARKIKEEFTYEDPESEYYGDNILVASVYALRSTIKTIDSYRELDLQIRLAFYYYLLALLVNSTVIPNTQFTSDYELEKIYQQFMKEEWPLWEADITEIWTDALAAKYHKKRDILMHDLKLSLRFLSYNLMQINPISIDRHTETLRQVQVKSLKAYFIREKEDTGYVVYLDAMEFRDGDLDTLIPRIGHIELFYNKGIEDRLRVNITYERPDNLGVYESFYIDHDKSGSILEYDRSDKLQPAGDLIREGQFASMEISFSLMINGSTEIDETISKEKLGYITAHISNPESSTKKEDNTNDLLVTHGNSWKFIMKNNYMGDYAIK